MPAWIPEAKWEGDDAFIIGGGPSLRDFDWKLLKDELTIGCNNAYVLGADVCKICIFGDAKWFRKHRDKLAEYKGVLFTNSKQFSHTKIEWLWTMPRKAKGLGARALGWNSNTGAAAVNLALVLGAKRIFLLGFDMHLSEDGNPNWHDALMDKPNAAVYEKFVVEFTSVSIDCKKLFPGREIINVTDNSDLDVFPKVGCEEFWKERVKVLV